MYPGEDEFRKWALQNIRLIRYPFRIERLMQGGTFTVDIQHIEAALDSARRHKQRIILDAHNYGRIRNYDDGRLIEADELATFWGMMATQFAGHEGLAAYGIMNEPHDMGGRWPSMAQAAVNQIRATDKQTLLLIAGENWSKAHSWQSANNDLHLQVQDPAGKMAFEAHQYLDPDGSGDYKECPTAAKCGAEAALADRQLGPFLDWCRNNNTRGFIGEIGFPADHGWKPVYERALELMKQNKVGATLWAAGPWWDKNYELLLDKPQSRWIVEKLGK